MSPLARLLVWRAEQRALDEETRELVHSLPPVDTRSREVRKREARRIAKESEEAMARLREQFFRLQHTLLALGVE